MKTAQEAFEYIESFLNLERTHGHTIREYRLSRMRVLLDMFDHPERSFRVIHLAGSKGKGSTAVMCASVIIAAGNRTGLFISPHVTGYKERFMVNGSQVDDEVIVELVNAVADRIDHTDVALFPDSEPPTTFELLTLLGFLIFRNAGCNWAVVETGIGGRLDTTNVLTPEICGITPIELEHTELLGRTIDEIASEKAGIIKPGVPIVTGFLTPAAHGVIERRAANLGSPLICAREEITKLGRQRQCIEIHRRDGAVLETQLALQGKFQAENAATAWLILDSLQRRGLLTLQAEQVKAGFSAAVLPGRFEIFTPGRVPVPVVLDGAHTPNSVNRVLESFEELHELYGEGFQGEGKVLVFGAVTGKDIEGMCRILGPRFSSAVVTTPGTFKRSDPKRVHDILSAYCDDCRLLPDPREAWHEALRLAGSLKPILVTGSFYLISEIRPFVIPEEH